MRTAGDYRLLADLKTKYVNLKRAFVIKCIEVLVLKATKGSDIDPLRRELSIEAKTLSTNRSEAPMKAYSQDHNLHTKNHV